MSEKISPEEFEKIDAWLETENGKKFIEKIEKMQELSKSQKSLLLEFLKTIIGPSNQDDDLYKEVGKFMVGFSGIESVLRMLIGIESKVQSLFKEAFMMIFDFSTLVNTLKGFYKKTIKDEKNKKTILKLLSECLDINNHRVKIAHGSWMFQDGKGVLLHMKKGAINSNEFFSDISELKNINNKIRKLTIDLLEFQAMRFDEWQTDIPED